jgi:hypothetical protein
MPYVSPLSAVVLIRLIRPSASRVPKSSIRRTLGDDEGRGRVFRQAGASFVGLLRRDGATDARAPFLRLLSRSARLEILDRNRCRPHVDRAGEDQIQ